MNGVVLGGGLVALLWLLLRKTKPAAAAATAACRVTAGSPPTAGDLAIFKTGLLATFKQAGLTPGTITVAYDAKVDGIRLTGTYLQGSATKTIDASSYLRWSDVAKGFGLVGETCGWQLPAQMRIK